MPFEPGEIIIGMICGRTQGWYDIQVDATALRRLGLHPDQPTSTITGRTRRR